MNKYNIQAGRNFAHIFCNYILQKYADNLLDITNLTIWVPSSRIATTIKDTFYSINGDMLLPQIKPFNLGEEAEEEILFNSNSFIRTLQVLSWMTKNGLLYKNNSKSCQKSEQDTQN